LVELIVGVGIPREAELCPTVSIHELDLAQVPPLPGCPCSDNDPSRETAAIAPPGPPQCVARLDVFRSDHDSCVEGLRRENGTTDDDEDDDCGTERREPHRAAKYDEAEADEYEKP
jgi:hypothetical protein